MSRSIRAEARRSHDFMKWTIVSCPRDPHNGLDVVRHDDEPDTTAALNYESRFQDAEDHPFAQAVGHSKTEAGRGLK